jgi:hypothetical protein
MNTARWVILGGLVTYGLVCLRAGRPTECVVCLLLALIVKP